MNCQTFRERLDDLTAQDRAADVEVSAHLACCSACQKLASRIETFDQRVSAQLRNIQAPEGLLEQILSQVNAELSNCEVSAPTVKKVHRSRPFTILSRVLVSGLAIAVMFVVALLWSPPTVESTFSYSAAQSELRQKFSHIDESSWSTLSPFDEAEFQIERLDSLIQKWNLSAPVGVDLGHSPAHDVAAFHFTFQRSERQKWSGTLIVLPTSNFTETPVASIPRPSSGVQMLEWSSSDGKLTYLCFVDEGSADELASVMNGILG